MNNRVIRETLNDSNIGEFKGKVTSRECWKEYAIVDISCCNYEYYKKIVEAVQPILDELTKEMKELIKSEEEE